ncbi:MAG: excinuclease ABC subunit UvrA [Candidatus Eisenbacteria bacterium]|uniref:UvrABC system protein A n=1 Tax=Eiseniibacteriota bacterium TaxID=2212470 RepID=A0A849T2X4_UNCEI|nr:excinuclease ABC subunit UvrA [Candidatus Eisenbacteria bacterium]
MKSPPPAPPGVIAIRGARQHNLRNLDLDLPRGGLTVITGVSGSGKSSLAFDTLYAEGQRRYVESVSSYARQFLERLPRPDVDSIHGLTPAVAIQQVAPARSARSTVATSTEIHDYLRILFARLGTVWCGNCGRQVAADSPQSITREADAWPAGARLLVLAPLAVRSGVEWPEQAANLLKAGYTRIAIGDVVHELDPAPRMPRGASRIALVVDRFTWEPAERERLADSCAQAFRRGEGRLELRLEGQAPLTRSERWECSQCGTPAMRPEPGLFSFNSPLGVCPTCRGFGNVLTFTPELIVPDPAKSLREGALDPWARSWRKLAWPRLEKLSKEQGVSLETPWRKLSAAHRKLLLEGGEGFRGVLPFLERLKAKSYKAGNRFIVKRYQTALPCEDCRGTRLRREALLVKVGDLNIAEVAALSVSDVSAWFAGLGFGGEAQAIAGPVLVEIDSRLRFLRRVDLGYLTLDRMTRTLSGGEAQRIELANALGANLADTLYVLDEPTVGLHPRDSDRLTEMLDELAARGNTLVVVEHEPILMRAADHLVDLGPGAGSLGGELLYSGPAGAALDRLDTETARYLRGEKRVTRARVQAEPRAFITIEGATHHNLKHVTARIPTARLTAVTGVSGSGKSSLVDEILYRVARRVLEGREEEPAGAHGTVTGLQAFKRVVMVDQSPIGRTPRSCPVSYIDAYAPLRAIFGAQPTALARGLKDGAFSFNTAGGRCDSCEGAGWVKVEMYFLADLQVPCEVCGGDRFRPEVLEVRYRGVNIREALDLTVDQAFEHFGREPRFTRTLQTLRRVGLGYLKLGQPATQLSGGEAQRLKIARELAERGAGTTLYLLDEPTVGLHFSDVQRLLEVLDDLVGRGDTVVVVEHNLDLIRNSDWVIDLGPDGGDGGGEIVAEGSPDAIAAVERSWTGRFLAAEMLRAAEART